MVDSGNKRRVAGQALVWGLVLVGVIGIFATLQRQLIYFPTVVEEAVLDAEAARLDLSAWRNEQGQLVGWRTVAEGSARRRILVFHGNAGLALQREYYVRGLQALRQGWEVFLFEYPGYGSRAGEPSEQGIKSAAADALALLLGEDDSPVYLIGESLGSGVASHLAANFPSEVRGLLLVTPFSSLTDVAAHHYRLLPVRTLLRERYDSMAALPGYRGPVAFLLAGDDEVVPVALGQRLHDAYAGPKWLRIIPGAGHNTLPLHPGADWWRQVFDFLLQQE